MTKRPAFTLVEVILAVAVGLVLMGSTIYAYRAAKAGSSLSKARTIVGTIQTNIGMEKFRLGSPPPMTPAPSATAVSVYNNVDSTGKAYWSGDVSTTSLPASKVARPMWVRSARSLLPTWITASPLCTSIPRISCSPSF